MTVKKQLSEFFEISRLLQEKVSTTMIIIIHLLKGIQMQIRLALPQIKDPHQDIIYLKTYWHHRRKEPIHVARSNTKAEERVRALAIYKLTQHKQLMTELSNPPTKPIKLYCSNQVIVHIISDNNPPNKPIKLYCYNQVIIHIISISSFMRGQKY